MAIFLIARLFENNLKPSHRILLFIPVVYTKAGKSSPLALGIEIAKWGRRDKYR